MQKVSQLPYQRVSMEEFAQEIQGIITQVKEASSAQAVMAARDQCNQLVIRWQTAEALSYMRYSINTADPFYLAERRTTMMRWVPRHRTTFWSTPRPCWRLRSDRNWRRVGRSSPGIPFLRGGAEIHFPGNHRGYGGGEPGGQPVLPADGGDGVRVPRGEAAPSHADEIRQVPGPGHAKGGL